MAYPLEIDTGKPKSICEFCGKEFEPTNANTQKYCSRSCSHAASEVRKPSNAGPTYQAVYRLKLRDQAYAILGEQCQFCGEKDKIVLNVDHIQAVGKKRKGIISTYWEIIRLPEQAKQKFQLLCRNCNWRKAINENEMLRKEEAYSYRWELEALQERVRMLENKIRLVQTTKKFRMISTEQLSTEIRFQKSEEEIISMILPSVLELKNRKGQIDMYKVKEVLREKYQVSLSTWKAYNLKKRLEISHPQLFEH
jgi:hypothetical protein